MGKNLPAPRHYWQSLPPRHYSPSVLVWNDAVVVRLAQAAYEQRYMPEGTLDNGVLKILADALEEAG
jgi:hypothetical protein